MTRQSPIEDHEFVFGHGDQALFENSNGTLNHIAIIRRLYDYREPTYQIRYVDDVFGLGIPCAQKWLRPLVRTARDVRQYAKGHSPAYVHR